MIWTRKDHLEALEEGWFYFSNAAGPRGPFQKNDRDDDKRFKTDEEVYNYILEGKSRVCKKVREHILSGLFK